MTKLVAVPTTGRKVQPLCLAAKQQRELMCAIAYAEGNEELEWFNDEDIGTSGLEQPPKLLVEAGTPVTSIDGHNPLWEKLLTKHCRWPTCHLPFLIFSFQYE